MKEEVGRREAEEDKVKLENKRIEGIDFKVVEEALRDASERSEVLLIDNITVREN